jgi:hypothetical protein
MAASRGRPVAGNPFFFFGCFSIAFAAGADLRRTFVRSFKMTQAGA